MKNRLKNLLNDNIALYLKILNQNKKPFFQSGSLFRGGSDFL